MEFGKSRRIKPKEKYVRISLKEIWRNLDGPPENKVKRSPVKVLSEKHPDGTASANHLHLIGGSFDVQCTPA